MKVKIIGRSVQGTADTVRAFATGHGLSVNVKKYNHWPGSEHEIVTCVADVGAKRPVNKIRLSDQSCAGNVFRTSYFLAEPASIGDIAEGPYGLCFATANHDAGCNASALVAVESYKNDGDLGRKAEDGWLLAIPITAPQRTATAPTTA